MSGQFNADEIFEIAEQIERNGAAFYRKAARTPSLARAAQILRQLADMEDSHAETFARMREDIWRQNPGWLPKFFDAEGENLAARYLRAIAEGLVFDLKQNPSEMLAGSPTPEQVLNFAITLEKDSIVFYLGVKDAVPEELGQAHIDRIIREEMSHITLLSRELAALQER